MVHQVDLCVSLLDGSTYCCRLRSRDTVAHLKSSLCASVGLTAGSAGLQLSCDGILLTDGGMLIEQMPPSGHLYAWTTRFTRARSDDALRLSHLRQRAAIAAQYVVWPQLVLMAHTIAAAVAQLPLRAWLRIGLWTSFAYGSNRVDLLGPYLIASSVWAVFLFGFQERAEGDESAYTVFNNGRALPGQLRGEDLQRDLVGM